jgi:hypothetical protein
MDRLLRELAITVAYAHAAGEDALEPIVLAGYRAAYQQIITLANQQNPARTIPTGKRGVIKQTPSPETSSCAWTATASKSCGSRMTSERPSITISPSATSA